jgi:hypothetical protein
MIGIIVGALLTGVLAGLWLNITMYRQAMKHSPNELIDGIRQYHAAYHANLDDDEDIDDPNSIIVSFEHVNSHWYLYDVSTNIFAGQGKSLDEAVEAVKARFPNKDVVVQQVKEPA